MTVPGPPIAYPVTMIESDIAGRTPAIRETSIWMINRHKANAGKEDGVFGSNTEAAVRRFQRARKNEGRDIGKVDGVIGSKTWAILWE